MYIPEKAFILFYFINLIRSLVTYQERSIGSSDCTKWFDEGGLQLCHLFHRRGTNSIVFRYVFCHICEHKQHNTGQTIYLPTCHSNYCIIPSSHLECKTSLNLFVYHSFSSCHKQAWWNFPLSCFYLMWNHLFHGNKSVLLLFKTSFYWHLSFRWPTKSIKMNAPINITDNKI